MPDREKAIKGLEYCKEYFNCCDKCPYWDRGTQCMPDLANEVLALLKEQEAKTGHWNGPECSCCHAILERRWRFEYCPHCGAKMELDV